MQAQPYRQGGNRQPSQALTAMQKGRSASGGNSADLTRAVQHLLKLQQQKPTSGNRPARPARTPRPPR